MQPTPTTSAMIAIALATAALLADPAAAAGPVRLYVPLAARNNPITEYVVSRPSPTPAPGATPVPTAAAPTPTPVAVAMDLTGRSSRTSGSFTYVNVKVQNTGSAVLYDVRVTATFRDARGAIAGVASGSARLSMLRPGEFSTVLIVAQPAAGWTTYDLLPDYPATSSYFTYVHDGLDLDAMNTYRSGSTVYVVGRLTNRSGRTVRSPLLDIGVYAPDGTVLDSGVDYPVSGSTTLPPDGYAMFSASFFDFDNRIPSTYSYTVRAEGYVPPS